MRTGVVRISGVLAAAAALVAAGVTPAAAAQGPGWTAAWSAAVQSPSRDLGPNWSADGFADQSVRQVVRVSTGGAVLRIRMSTVYNSAPLRLTGATVGKAGAGAEVVPGTLRQLTFGGSPSPVLAAGREWLSEPVPLATAPLEKLSVTFYFAGPTGPSTYHAFAMATGFRAPGNHVSDRHGAAFTETGQSWFNLAGVEVAGGFAPRRGTVVAFGDSISDGVGSSIDGDNRYPDQLAERLIAQRRPLGVVDAGIGGSRLLTDSSCFGEKMTARFQRDALGQPGVRSVIVLAGTNDIIAPDAAGFECFNPATRVTARQIVDGYRQLIRAAHARGVRVIGATVLPFGGSEYDTPAGRQIRDDVNAWIQTGGEYDAVVDFSRVIADPADHQRVNPAYDSGDKLHPNDAGYQAMAAAVDLGAL